MLLPWSTLRSCDLEFYINSTKYQAISTLTQLFAKLVSSGRLIRIIFRIVNAKIEIVQIIAIGQRDKGKVFTAAEKRIR